MDKGLISGRLGDTKFQFSTATLPWLSTAFSGYPILSNKSSEKCLEVLKKLLCSYCFANTFNYPFNR
jgi:hypothetical protein